MKKFLLLPLATVALCVHAESRVYFFGGADGEFEQMGSVYSVSPNGEYAVIYDGEMEESFLWRRSDPERLESLNVVSGGTALPTEVRAVNDNGTVVGSVRERGSNQWQPFIKPLGEDMYALPMKEWVLNLNYPCGITNDERIIAGQLSRPGGGIGQKCPAIWVKGDDGEYEVTAYPVEELSLPAHQGTNVTCVYSDGTYDGTWIGGAVACGAGSDIPFLYNRDRMILFNKLESHRVPWWYRGEIQGYTSCTTIDGFRDYYFRANDAIIAGFYGCDMSGNFYGSLPEVYDVQSTDPEDADFGNASVRYHHGFYNVITGEWTARADGMAVSTGLDGQVLFTSGNTVKPDGVESVPVSISQYLGVDFGGRNMLGVNRVSASGDVLGFTYSSVDAVGVEHAYPAILVSDSPLVGVRGISSDPESGVAVITRQGAIEVTGADKAGIYDMNGILVGTGKADGLPAGTYIVTFGAKSMKVAVM